MTKAEVQQQLDDVLAFMRTTACRNMLRSIDKDIADVEASILQCPPDNAASQALQLRLHGQRTQLLLDTKIFEAARDSLKDLLDKLSDGDTQVTQQTEQ